MHRHRKRTHTLGNGDTTQQPARDSEGELAAATAAPPPPPPPLLLLLLLCCCCCAAAVLLLCCCCFSTHDASRSTTCLNRLFLVLCFMERTQERVTAQQQQRPAPLRSLGLAVVLCLRCRTCVRSFCVFASWLSLVALVARFRPREKKLGACRPIVWTSGARMNLERSSVQVVHSFGKFRAVFFVNFVQFSSFGWIFE